MKRITATIKPNMLDDVVAALHHLGDLPGATVAEVRDVGPGPAATGRRPFGFATVVRLELICPGERAAAVATAIARAAHTGMADDGRVDIAPVDTVLDIRSAAP